MKQFRLYYISWLLGIILIGNALILKADISGKIPIVRLATKSTELLYYCIMNIHYEETNDKNTAIAYREKADKITNWFKENQNKPDVKVYTKILKAALGKMLNLLFSPTPFRSI
jgi:hypothetical protein